MIIKIAVCDDDSIFLAALKKHLFDESKKLKKDIEINPYEEGTKLINDVIESGIDYDIIFLDVDMPDMSGLEIAKMIRNKKENVLLIFLSAHPQYVFEALEYVPFRYIRKERMEKELILALKEAFNVIEKIKEKLKEEYIVLKDINYNSKVKKADIVYFETSLRKVEVHLKDGNVLTIRKTIKELYEELKEEHFIKIHSGCAVNPKYINKYSNYDVELDSGEKLIVSRTRIKELKKQMLDYWGVKI